MLRNWAPQLEVLDSLVRDCCACQCCANAQRFGEVAARRGSLGQGMRNLVETVFDWVTVLTFACLAVLYLERSASAEQKDRVWHYIPPAVGCAIANYLGNEGYEIGAVVCLVCVIAYIYYALRPQFGF